MRTINKYVKPSYAVDVWSDHLKSFDSDFMGYDLPTGKGGNIPDSKTYKLHVPNGGWRVPQSYPTLLDRVKSHDDPFN
jgi:penicillin-binding protein 2